MAAAYGSDSPSGNFNAYDAITRAQYDMQRLLDSDTNGTDDADGTHQMSSFGVNGHTNGVGLVSQNGDRNGDASSSHSADTALNALSGDPATHCVMANFAYTSLDANQLSFAKGDIIQVFIEDPSGWWEGVLIKSDLPEYGCRGWFPHNYARKLSEQSSRKALDRYAAMALGLDSQSVNTNGADHCASNGIIEKADETETLDTAISVDAILGRNARYAGSSVEHLMDSVLHGRGQYGESLNDFSTGGDIFEELAAAAASRDDSSPEASRHVTVHDPQAATLVESDVAPSPRVEDDWLPKMSADGRIYYFNSRTGASVQDLPSAGLSPAVGTSGIPSESSAQTAGQAANSSRRPISTYSDDSDIDAGFGPTSARTSTQMGRPSLSDGFDPSATPRKVSNATFMPPYTESPDEPAFSTTPARRAPLDVFDRDVSRLAAVHLACQPPKTKTWSLHEKHCLEAVQHLVSLVRGWEVNASSSAPLAAQDSTAEREQLEATFRRLHHAVAALLHATGLVNEPTSRFTTKRRSTTSTSASSMGWSASTRISYSSMGNLAYVDPPALPSLDVSTFRPSVMKMTAMLSKLALTVRTLWSQTAASTIKDSSAVDNALLDDGLTDGEREHLRQQNRVQAVSRQEVRSKLGQDLIGQSQLLSNAIGAFVDEIEAFAHGNGINVRKGGLATVKRSRSDAVAAPIDLLQPSIATVATLRGHGYVRASLSSVRPASPANGRPSALNIAAVMQVLSATSLAELSDQAAQLTRDVYTIQDELSDLGPTAITAQSHASAKGQYLGRCQTLLTTAAVFLRNVETMDLAKRLDIQLSPELYTVLTGESLQSILEQDLFAESSSTRSPGRGAYASSLSEAMVTLSTLEAAKRQLYLAMHRLALSLQHESMTSPLTSHEMRSTPAQPVHSSPLNAVDAALSQLAPSDQIAVILGDFTVSALKIVDGFSTALSIADKQATCPASQRRANAALRASLLEPPTSAISASSSSLALPQAGRRLRDDDTTERLTEDHFDIVQGHGSYRGSLAPAASINETLSSLLVGPRSAGQRSRAGSMADSLASTDDLQQGSPNPRYRRDAAEDLRRAMQDAGLGSPHHASPSKSKLKQFFGADAPGNNVHRPPTAARDVPLFLQSDYKHTDLSWASDGTVRGGTLYALVCRLTNHSSADASFNNAFLMTYRTFTTSEMLLEHLAARYRIEPPADLRPDDYMAWADQKQKLIRIRVTNVLRTWVSDYLYDDEDERSFQAIVAFIETLPAETALQLSRILERRRTTGTPRRLTASVSAGLTPNPIVPRSLKKIKFLEIDPLEVARQFTIMDSRLFTRITPEECLSKAWPKKFNRGTPTFQAIADMSNAVTAWVAMTIVLQPEARRRVAIVKHFIAIADKCRQLSNFTTLMHIVAGLNCSAVYRLKRTWELVSQRAVSTLTFLGNLMSPENNHALYRDALRLVGAPCVPFLGIFFTDWVMAGEANSDVLRDKPEQINFAKRSRVSDSIQQIQLQQATPYNLMPVPELNKWLEEELAAVRRIMTAAATAPSDGASTDIMAKAYELSLKIEPREREDERIARLLSESGFL